MSENTLRVFVYREYLQRCAAVQEVAVDRETKAIADDLLARIPDARFSFEDSVTVDDADDPDLIGEEFAMFQFEGTIDVDGEPTYHELCIDSRAEGTTIDQFDWSNFCWECSDLIDFLSRYDRGKSARLKGCAPPQTTGSLPTTE